MKVLITGGAGYIGSSVAWMFVDRGHKVTIIDNLKTGKLSNIPKKSKFIKSDIADIKTLNPIFSENYDVVLHFAALIDNEDSISNKELYLRNNYYKSKIFFKLCMKKGIKNFIFSSSAAVYGLSDRSVDESSKTRPLAPYGKSKLKFEKFLEKSKNKINYVILRYFNVVGVEKKMRCGFEIKKNKSLFNNLCKAYVNNKNFSIFGKDFRTKDGTAVRDYIYIGDLSDVHFKFAKIIQSKKLKLIVNCGYGVGYSVLDVINKFNSIFDKKINFYFKRRRKNEIEYSVADTKKINKFFKPKNSKNKLITMIKSSLVWYKYNSNRINK
jgi:UDP-glucose 4-epimerase